MSKALPPIRHHFEVTTVLIFGTNLSSLPYDIIFLCVLYAYYIYYRYFLYTYNIRGRLGFLYFVFPRFCFVT